MNTGETVVSQANVEFFFRLFYNCIHGSCLVDVNTAAVAALLSHIWLWIVYVGYIFSVLGLMLIIYCMIRLFELRKREAEYYSTVIHVSDTESTEHPRWENIQSLLQGTSPSEWREAIIEADIMLDDILTQAGYSGESISEKLKKAEHSNFSSRQDAWEAHKVRNQIAHEGSAFDLTASLAQRTIARYEHVFREFKAIQ